MRELQEKHALIGDVRGMGLLQAIELVEDRTTKAPAARQTVAVMEACRISRSSWTPLWQWNCNTKNGMCQAQAVTKWSCGGRVQKTFSGQALKISAHSDYVKVDCNTIAYRTQLSQD